MKPYQKEILLIPSVMFLYFQPQILQPFFTTKAHLHFHVIDSGVFKVENIR